jgi:hypothetical protein
MGAIAGIAGRAIDLLGRGARMMGLTNPLKGRMGKAMTLLTAGSEVSKIGDNPAKSINKQIYSSQGKYF